MLYRVLITLESRIPCFQRGLNTSTRYVQLYAVTLT